MLGFHPSTHSLLLFRYGEKAEANTRSFWVRGRVTLHIQRITGPTYREKQPFTLIFTPEARLKSPIHPQGLWEKPEDANS